MKNKITDGYCNNCEEPSMFRYHNSMEIEVEDNALFPMYNCEKCHSTLFLRDIVKDTQKAIESGLIKRMEKENKTPCKILKFRA